MTRREEVLEQQDFGLATIVVLALALMALAGSVIFFGSGFVFAKGPESLVSAVPGLSATVVRPAVAATTVTYVANATEASAPESAAPAHVTRYKVANTGGDGVYLRRDPASGARVMAWPEGTIMEPQGEPTELNGRRWLKVKDPQGNVGFVPLEFLAPAG
ncbi:MAG: hypothetical protein HY329_04600 [Chloroflexi bacterium]|nr:hypothetical protein [Chloroflexota bacterium]